MASSLADGDVFVSQVDIDRHAVIDGARGSDLAQVERLGLGQAIEAPNEFVSVGHEPYHFAVLHVDILGVAVDDQCTHSRGCLGGLAQRSVRIVAAPADRAATERVNTAMVETSSFVFMVIPFKIKLSGLSAAALNRLATFSLWSAGVSLRFSDGRTPASNRTRPSTGTAT